MKPFIFFPVVLLFAFDIHAIEKQVVRGHVPAAVARLQPVDRLSATNHLHLSIGLPMRNRPAFTNLLQQLYDPASPTFRKYLTAEQFTEQFGPTEHDYQAVTEFVRANGLTVTGTHPNRMLLDVTGSAANVEQALHVNLRVYPHPKEARTFYAPDGEPALDLQVPVLHIGGLNNYARPHPRSRRAPPENPTTHARPQAGSGTNGSYLGKDFRTAYVPRTALTGAGQVVALVEFDGYQTNNISSYQTLAGLSPNVPLQNVLIHGFSGFVQSASGDDEVSLDIEMAIAMAPGLSKIVIYEADPFASLAITDELLNRIATDNSARQISCSWGFDITVTTQQIFQQYAAQGQSFFLASGDSGAFTDVVEQPSDDPNITTVGGTTLTTSSFPFAYTSERVWQTSSGSSSGGISTLYSIPSWQQGISMTANKGSTTMRNLPDVAMVGDNVQVIAENNLSRVLQGTSISAPLWAGFTALVNQQAAASGKQPVGFLNPALYTLGKSANYTTYFHDVTTGNNGTSGSLTKYPAVTGYDLCTGWGTPKVNLINALLALAPSDPLLITPPLGFTANGAVGGPFNITSQNYTLTNAGVAALNWTLVNPAAWLKVSPSSGTLTPGGPATTVTVTLNSAASNLLIGNFSTIVSFTNLTDGVAQNRDFKLSIGNGSFETGDFINWNFSGDPKFNYPDSFDNALLNGNGGALPGVADIQFVHSGIYGAFLGQATTLGSLSQTLPTVAGQRYLVSFWLDNPAAGTPNHFFATWNGSTLFTNDNAGIFGWTNLQYSVTATGSSSTLQFGFQNDTSAFGLDDISVQPIPAPVFQPVPPADSAVTLTWSTLAGVPYQLQYKTDLNQTNWINFSGSISATNSSMSVSDPISSSPQRFYRVLLP